MSQENVQVVRRAFESFNRRDLAGAVAVFHRDAEWVPYLAALEEEIYRGRDDIERMWREVLTDVPDFHIQFQGFRTAAEALEAVGLRE
jgi:ketosteroid isomerase-like protein